MNESLLLMFIAILNLIFVVALFKKFRDKEAFQSDKDIEALRLKELEEQRNANGLKFGARETNEEREKRIIFTNAAEKIINDKESTIGKLISDQGSTIATLNEDTKRMIENTDRLRNILNNPNRTGKYGEMDLKSLLDLVDFKENTHYLKGKQIANGKIPDFTFKLPENKVVHVDCKFSTSKAGEIYEDLKNLRKNLNDETNDEKHIELEKDYKKEVNKFTAATKGQIDDLVDRKYAGSDENTLDFAFLYIPTESSYAFLIEQRITYEERKNKIDIPLLHYALKNRVILTNPSLMMAYLNTVKRSLMTHNLSENIKKISDLHNSFKLEWNTFANSFDEIETALDGAKDKLEAYRGTRKKALQRIVDQMEAVEDLSDKEIE
jgi:DNA recombination protein RmuC